MDAFAVVEAFESACQAGIELSIAHEAALVGKLCLQGMEEALHVGVVLAVARIARTRDRTPGGGRSSIRRDLIQSTMGSGLSEEDFAMRLRRQARSSGMDLKPENVPVRDGLV